MSAELDSLERDAAILGLMEKFNRLDDHRAAQLLALHAELAELRDELVTQEQRHRRDVDALRESIRATDRVLSDRTAHLA